MVVTRKVLHYLDVMVLDATVYYARIEKMPLPGCALLQSWPHPQYTASVPVLFF